jgi:diamine N-acetyltransferase
MWFDKKKSDVAPRPVFIKEVNRLVIREASKTDIDFIMRQEARDEIGKWLLPATKQDHLARRRDPDYRYEVLVNHEEQPLGYAILRGFESPYQSIELMRLAVATPGKGIGRAFLEKLISRSFTEWGAHRLWLDMFEDNINAERLYRKVGFHPEGTLREAVKKDGKWLSLKIMSILAPAAD